MRSSEQLARGAAKLIKSGLVSEGTSLNLSDIPYYVPTRSLLLNLLLSGGGDDKSLGVPACRIMEIFGLEKEGKSTVLQEIQTGFQVSGGLTMLVDPENKWWRERAVRMGHDEKLHFHSDADTVEAAFEDVYDAVGSIRKMEIETALSEALAGKEGKSEKVGKRKKGKAELTAQERKSVLDSVQKCPVCVGWDSIAATATESAMDPDRKKYADGMAGKPRLVREELRKIAKWCARENVTLIFVNQLIANIEKGNPFAPKWTTAVPALRFWSSTRLAVRHLSKKIAGPSGEEGVMTQVKLWASSVTRPSLAVNLALLYDTGLDPDLELLEYGIDNKLKAINASENGAWKYIVAPKEDFETFCPGLAVKDHAEKGFAYVAFQSAGFRELIAGHVGLRTIMRDAVKKHWRGQS